VSRMPTLVVTYHAIREGPAPLCVAPEQLARHLDLLLESGFEAHPVESLLRPRAAACPRVCVTFDDGYRDFLEQALPVLEERGVPATLFAIASKDRSGVRGGVAGALLSFDELAEVARRGVTVAAHGLSHVPLAGLAPVALERELVGGRRRLEDCIGGPVDLIAYPFGAFDARVRAAVATAGFRGAFTSQLAPVPRECDLLAIPRVDAHYMASPTLRLLIARGRPEPYLHVRRWLRRLRGSEPRRPVPRFRPLGRRPGSAL
jgi:peptidoglycan/xylan/chitin deacetylase (PgdA/CDA1 family)